MLEIELQLPLDTKRVEWNKENPTFGEVKERLWSCGVARNWCVEVLRGNEFFSPDENHIFSAKQLTVRALPISGILKRPRVSHPKAKGCSFPWKLCERIGDNIRHDDALPSIFCWNKIKYMYTVVPVFHL